MYWNVRFLYNEIIVKISFSSHSFFPFVPFLLRLLCGSRVRVEMSTGMSRKGRGRPSRRQFDPNDRCYQCGDRGHYAYDCYRFSKRGRRSRWELLSLMHFYLVVFIYSFSQLYCSTISKMIDSLFFFFLFFTPSQVTISVPLTLKIRIPWTPLPIPLTQP